MNREHPPISVVIPAYNEAAFLPRCLAALMPQARACGAEVIVVDNGSMDGTAGVARSFGARVVEEPRRGYIFALRSGIASATNTIIAVTDADTTVAADWCARLSAVFQDATVVAVTGTVRYESFRVINFVSRLIPHELWGANMAFRRSAYEAVGGVDTTVNLSADIVLSRKLKMRGRIAFEPKLRVVTSSRRYLAQPVRQSARYSLNYLWLQVFRRPLFWDFAAIRETDGHLRRRNRRRNAAITGIFVILLLGYFFLWPTSSDFGRVMADASTDNKVVALTFDDGPNGAATRAIVDILTKERVPATFFEIGQNVAADPATAAYVASHGFTIGNHSWDHSYFLPVERPQHVREELARTSAAIAAATGTVPQYFRPPHGLRSPFLLDEVSDAGMRVVDWSVDPQDYFSNDPKTIVSRVVHRVRPGGIILLHDGLQDGPRAKALRARSATIAALPTIIHELRARGYRFVSLHGLEAQPPRRLVADPVIPFADAPSLVKRPVPLPM